MKRVLGLVCAIVLVFGVACNVAAISLGDLVGGSTITADDKLFSNWSLDIGSYDQEVLWAIEVTAISDPTNPGLYFASTMPIDIMFPDESRYFSYGFTVTSQDPSMEIVDSTLEIDDYSFVGDGGAILGDGYIHNPATSDFAYLDVQVDNDNDVWEPTDTAAIDPGSVWEVEVYWELYTDLEGDEVALDGWKQTFSQAPVPEPATVLLLGTGLVGLAGFRKKFKK